VTRAELRAGLDLLPTWALQQKAAANRRVIAVVCRRLAAGAGQHAARHHAAEDVPCRPWLGWPGRSGAARRDRIRRPHRWDQRPEGAVADASD
jgi:hypothetical protein